MAHVSAVTPVIVSYSELDTFRQCPLKHALAYGQRWTRPVKDDSALSKGTLYHKVMETHYRELKKYQDAAKTTRFTGQDERNILAALRAQVMQHLVEPGTGAQTDVQALIEWMYDGYIEQYRLTPEWRVIAVEHNIVTPLRDERGRRSRYHLKAKIDLLVRDNNGGLWVVDHKSGGNLPSQLDLEIDDQFGLYTWALKEMGHPVLGAIHLANRTQRNKSFMPLDTRLSRTYLNRTDAEIRNLALDAYRAARAAHPPKSEQRPPYSAPDPRQCGWKCDFKEPHLLMRQGRKPSEVLTEYGFRIDRTRH